MIKYLKLKMHSYNWCSLDDVYILFWFELRLSLWSATLHGQNGIVAWRIWIYILAKITCMKFIAIRFCHMLNDAKAEDLIYACILSTSSKSFAVRSHCEYLTSVYSGIKTSSHLSSCKNKFCILCYIVFPS